MNLSHYKQWQSTIVNKRYTSQQTILADDHQMSCIACIIFKPLKCIHIFLLSELRLSEPCYNQPIVKSHVHLAMHYLFGLNWALLF